MLCLPSCLRDSLIFAVAVSAFYWLWLLVHSIANHFQSTIRDVDNKVFITLPWCYHKWF